MVAYNKHDPFQCKIKHNYRNYIQIFDLCAWYKSSISLNMVSFIIYIVFTEDKQKKFYRIISKQSLFPTKHFRLFVPALLWPFLHQFYAVVQIMHFFGSIWDKFALFLVQI